MDKTTSKYGPRDNATRLGHRGGCRLLWLAVALYGLLGPLVGVGTGGNIYWIDEGKAPIPGKVQRANLDGTNVQDLVTSGLTKPRGIALDTAAGKMYWIDEGKAPIPGKVQRANLDGTNVQDLITSGLTKPKGIALDTNTGFQILTWQEVESQ